MIFENPLARRRASIPRSMQASLLGDSPVAEPDVGERNRGARQGQSRRIRGQAGLSLIEVLFSFLILLVITLSIIPLFSRAIQSNRRGLLATQMSSFVTADVEGLNQVVVNHPSVNEDFLDSDDLKALWSPTGEGTTSLTPGAPKIEEIMRLFEPSDRYGTGNPVNLDGLFNGMSTRYLATGPKDQLSEQDKEMADEIWMTETEYLAAGEDAGDITWLKDVLFFNYNISDVHSGTIATSANPDVQATTVVQTGNPRLFDNPIAWDSNDAPDIREIRVGIRRSYAGHPTQTGSLSFFFGHFRAF